MAETTLSPARAAGTMWVAWSLLVIAVFAVGVSAIIIRYAQEAHPLALSFWRCAAGAALLAPFGRGGFGKLQRNDWILPLLAGLFLALHFATWITSLELTSVANSVLLVCTAPVFVAFGARFFLKERMGLAVWAGIALALGGTALIAASGTSGGKASFSGDALALIGAIVVAGYALAGQISRQKLGIVEYSVITYGAGAVLLLPVCLIAGVDLFGYSAQTWIAILGMVLGPQILGHTVLNYVVKDIDATTIYAAVMAEPPIAIALAWLLFDEVPSLLVYPGGLAILIGILMVSISRRERPETRSDERVH
ncbi:MAG TPA: DMT family transporter [Actinomycetota bacterium]|nr:DMT family transporter [Actinomycetota bacterium]